LKKSELSHLPVFQHRSFEPLPQVAASFLEINKKVIMSDMLDWDIAGVLCNWKPIAIANNKNGFVHYGNHSTQVNNFDSKADFQ
jgi:hypothetical protein